MRRGRLASGFLPFCVFVASVLCFTVLVLIPKLEETDVLKSSIARFPRRSFSGETTDESGSGPTSGEMGTRQESSGEVDLASRQNWTDFIEVDQELAQLMRESTRQVAARHVIKEKLDKLLESSGSPDSGTAEAPYDYNELSCTPQHNVLFLKTHKTGSSTLTNILNRYADIRELAVALPAPGLYRFHWPSLFHWGSVDRLLLNGQLANIFSNHARYNRPNMDFIMADNTKYITILRNPVEHFESTFNYMELYSFFRLPKRPDSLEKFLSQPFAYLRYFKERYEVFPEPLHLIRNGMLFDLGLHTMYHDNETAIRRAVEKLEQDFSLVLMTDYFDESLVLLKREFCWDLDDVLYIKLNQRRSHDKTSNISRKTYLQDAIRRWNWADVILYEHFNKTFWNKVRSHGEEFYRDLEHFRKKNREMHQECVAPDEVTESAFGTTGTIKGFRLNGNVSRYNRYLCEKILTNEIEYIEYFRRKFHPRFGYRQQLVNEGLVKPSTTDKLAERFAAMHSAPGVSSQPRVPRPLKPRNKRLGRGRRSSL